MIGKTAPVIVIFGPTAGGKTALAIEVARELGGEVVNADSRQIYKNMPIISACPSAQEYQMVPHHLFEFVDPRERFSAGRWAQMASRKIGEIMGRGKVAVVVGGTGFYLRALMEGMSEIPDVPEAVEAQFVENDTSSLYAVLLGFDPIMAQKLKPNDRQRILRALTVHAHTGKTLSAWQQGAKSGADFEFLKIGVKPERSTLHARIAQRWEGMFMHGAVEEVRALRDAGYKADDAALKGLAIPDFFAHLEGKMTEAEVKARAIARDRQYAKRQYTWLNNTYRAEVMLERPDAGVVRDEWQKRARHH